MRVRLVCTSWGQYTFLCQFFVSLQFREMSRVCQISEPFRFNDSTLGYAGEGPDQAVTPSEHSFQVFLVFAFAFILEPRPSPLPRFPLHPASLDCCCGCEGALLARARSPRAVDFRFVPYVSAMPMDSCTVGAEASSASWWSCFAYHAAEACKVAGPVH